MRGEERKERIRRGSVTEPSSGVGQGVSEGVKKGGKEGEQKRAKGEKNV